MNIYAVSRKIIATVLGLFWGYRATIWIEKGITYSQYFISFIWVMFFLFTLMMLISKQKKTKDINIIKKEIWKDVIWAMVSITLGFITPYIFSFILT